MDKPRVILTCFAGRKCYMEILMLYVNKLLDQNDVTEFHVWDYTRDPRDELWLGQQFGSANNSRIKLIKVRQKKTWGEYYQHYTKARYPNCIIVKADDDIVFIDTQEFAAFIQRRIANTTHLLAFPSIVNNDMGAFFQQQFGLLPPDLLRLPFPQFWQQSQVWQNGKKAEVLHNYFLEHAHSKWLPFARGLTTASKQVPEGVRVSINFFAIRSDDLDLFQRVAHADDEHELTERLPRVLHRTHYIDPAMTVAHFAFRPQRKTGLNEPPLLEKYREFAQKSI